MTNALQDTLDQAVDLKKIFGTSFSVKMKGKSQSAASGNMQVDQPFFIASTTKLFTTALILNLQSANHLNLNDKIGRHLEESILKDLHILKGSDYSGKITIEQLLAHTSGLPDYFQGKTNGVKSLEKELMEGKDQSWTFEEAVERSKTMKPLFAPGTKNKAHYADTNFQLLGKIILNCTGKTFSENCKLHITEPLGLSQTYLYEDPHDKTPAPLHYKTEKLIIPRAMTSFGPDGGMVSTSSELLTFAEAFFSGRLFPAEFLKGLQQWRPLFFPLQSGTGIHRFKLPWLFNPAGTVPELIGHSGLSGALAFFSPVDQLFIAGTVNQVAHPDLSFRTMIKLIRKLQKSA